ncbi:DNA topoisomerase III [Bacillus anthracis]|uniref:DNA topoisomerase III n=1 Tax=Bacillus TaxID=1386 RepID=UPI0008FDC300|nr:MULTISPECIES: DNA topoisomerase III [Bacillus]MBL3854061.1 DNA topoisomerase III [Bacillus cereus]MDR4410049.1 DNA topoisomerase III [Bacillus anthracis]OJE21757.1 DNA topoisomerase III [Bacillus paranthracis]TSI15275.1 DNA topoisomerase III [Bacillus sp. HY001]
MKLIIAEKPDQGAKLAAPFSHKKRNGYIEIAPNDVFPKGAYLSWAVGHLCELIPPEEYDPKWKKWSLNTLPIIPEKFNHRVTKSKWKQFNIIKELVHHNEVNEIIIAGDAEREGEAIIRLTLMLCRNNKPMKRLWISSLTQNAVTNGFENLLDEKETRNLYYEAYSRSCADWLVGMNASRAYTLLLQQKGISDVFSTGRVQTPTLALIVKREKEIENFKSEPFWEVNAKFNMDGKVYMGKWHKDNDSRIKEAAMAHKIAQFCNGKDAEVHELEKERKEFQPPFLFNLSSLQAEANKRFKYSPQQTLDIAQKLYIKGIISYPRSDSSFVTKEEASMFPDILQKISNIEAYSAFFPLPFSSIMENKRYVNEKKVTDHYAIIPTEQVTDPSRLSGEEQKIYDLVIRRLLAAHYDKAIFDYTTVNTLVDGRATFISKGKEEIQSGWRKVIFGNKKEKNKDEDEQDLPSLEKGEQGIVQEVTVKEGKTQPPKRYTEGQLITLMKTAGKYLDNEELTKVLNKTEGLGTEATRAGIIGVLKDRKYIEVKKNQVSATDKGKLLIDAIGDSILASPEMTAKWEQRLDEIGDGIASPSVFMEQTKKLTLKLIDDAKEQSGGWDFQQFDLTQFQGKPGSKKKSAMGTKVGKCKKCDGDVVDKSTFYGCSNYSTTKCDFTISKKILGKTISQKNMKKLLNGEQTDLIKGFKKSDKTFDAKLGWKDDKINFVFEK